MSKKSSAWSICMGAGMNLAQIFPQIPIVLRYILGTTGIILVIIGIIGWCWDWIFNQSITLKICRKKDRITVHEFLAYIGIDISDTFVLNTNAAFNALFKLRQLAFDGKIQIWGQGGHKYQPKQDSRRPIKLIEKDYWEEGEITTGDAFAKNPYTAPNARAHALGYSKEGDRDSYRDLLISSNVKQKFKKDEYKVR